MAVVNRSATRKERDLIGSRWAVWLFWIAPCVLIISSGGTIAVTHTVAWIDSFIKAGVAYVANTRRCGRPGKNSVADG